MGLFGSTKKKKYGQAATQALQPGLLQSYSDIMRSGGGPETWLHRAPLNDAIQGAYERAARDLGAAGINPTGLQPLRETATRDLYGKIGQGMNQAKMGTTGNMASYISALTSGRPSGSKLNFLGKYMNFMQDWEKFASLASGTLGSAGEIAGAFPMPSTGGAGTMPMGSSTPLQAPFMGSAYDPMTSYRPRSATGFY